MLEKFHLQNCYGPSQLQYTTVKLNCCCVIIVIYQPLPVSCVVARQQTV